MDLLKTKNIIARSFPPIIIDFFKYCRSIIKKPEWEYVSAGWNYPARGWDKKSVALVNEKQLDQIKDLIGTNHIFGYSHESSNLSSSFDLAYHNLIMIFGYSLARVSSKRDQITMLDWGGGLGHYLLIGRHLMPDLEIQYACKETFEMCNRAKSLNLEGLFSHSEDTIFSKKYDFILASGSLHYENNWEVLLTQLAKALNRNGYLLVTYQPFIERSPSFVFIQRPYQYGYQTEYLGWCLNKHEFIDTSAKVGLHSVQEFMVGYCPHIHGAPEQNNYMGLLFQKEG